jgi:hypothetical protein
MFFAETLGPAITRRMGTGLYEHLQQKLAGRASASSDDLKIIVSEFIRTHGMQVTVDAAIQYLMAQGYVARQDAGAFRLAA